MVEKKVPFTKILFKKGLISTLYGLPDSGKTNFAVFLMENAVDNGFHVWTIIHFFPMSDVVEARGEELLPRGVNYRKLPSEVHTVKKISDLLLGLLSHRPNVTILDEAGIFASSRSPMSKKLKDLMNLTFIIRHLQSSFFYIAQTSGSIPPDLRKTLVRYEMDIEKVTDVCREVTIKSRQSFINDEGVKEIAFIPIDKVKDIPLTRYPWDGHYIPKFEFDISLDEAWNRLGDYNSLEVRKVGADIIRELVVETNDNKKGMYKQYAEDREKARKLFAELQAKGKFSTKGKLLAHVGNKFGKTYQWAYQTCRDLDFDDV